MKTEKSLLSKKELLEIFLHHRVHSPFPGDWQSIYRGSGYEFWALREMEPTDDVKNVDWKATARAGKHYVKEYLAESYYNLMILYDISSSVSFGRKELVQANIAVSLAHSAIVGNNGCGLILFADEVVSYLPPRMGRPHFMQILSAIAEAKPVSCKTTRLDPALSKLVGEVPESLTFILSDFLFPFDCSYHFQKGPHGTSRHEVKALIVLESSEKELPAGAKGLMPLSSYETGETVVLDLSKRRAYNASRKRWLEETRDRMARAGMDTLVLTPEENFQLEINAFMQQAGKRSR
jgi:uncharacterized protein (DUF58 family)